LNAHSLRKYDFIDALRGFAILAVILFHTGQIVQPSSSQLGALAGNGYLGVQLFYVTSALTLCLSMSARKNDETAPTRNFFIRRFFRIAPMFYLALAVFFLLDGMSARYWAPTGLHWWYPISTLLFLHGWHPETIDSVVPGGWSIAIEMSFYLLLPLLFVLLKDIKTTLFFILITLIIGWDLNQLMTRELTPLYPQSEQYLVTSFTYYWLPNQLPVFGLGILLYHIFARYRNLQDRFLGLVLLLVSFFMMAAFFETHTYNELLPHHVLMAVGFCFLALGLYFSQLRLLVNPVTTLIGKISFSMYLVHFGMLRLMNVLYPHGFPLKGDAGTAIAFFLVAGSTILVSYATYQLIEKPGIHLGAVLINRLDQARLPATARPE
jgi:peptidoglycan/LPS O-acetylase OafA/YrhL